VDRQDHQDGGEQQCGCDAETIHFRLPTVIAIAVPLKYPKAVPRPAQKNQAIASFVRCTSIGPFPVKGSIRGTIAAPAIVPDIIRSGLMARMPSHSEYIALALRKYPEGVSPDSRGSR